MYTQVDDGADSNFACHPKGEHCDSALKHTSRHDATENGRKSVTLFRGDIIPMVECSQLESMTDNRILEQDVLIRID